MSLFIQYCFANIWVFPLCLMFLAFASLPYPSCFICPILSTVCSPSHFPSAWGPGEQPLYPSSWPGHGGWVPRPAHRWGGHSQCGDLCHWLRRGGVWWRGSSCTDASPRRILCIVLRRLCLFDTFTWLCSRFFTPEKIWHFMWTDFWIGLRLKMQRHQTDLFLDSSVLPLCEKSLLEPVCILAQRIVDLL